MPTVHDPHVAASPMMATDAPGGSAMAPLIRDHDWSTSPLGPMDQWPAALKGILDVGLASRFPVCIYWGPEFVLLYNDAWSSIPGDKHPACLGQSARDAWSDIWSILDPMYNGILQTGVAVHAEDGLLPMERFGYVEEAYFSYNVSPIFDEYGKPAGLFNTVIETTAKVLQARRSRLLTRLSERLGQALESEQIYQQALTLLAESPEDVPFCLFYRGNALQAGGGLPSASPLAPATLSAADDPFGLLGGAEAARACRLAAELALPLQPWPEPVAQAYASPLRSQPEQQVVFGISPRRPLDEDYQRFLDELAGVLDQALALASRQQAERLAGEAVLAEMQLRTRERDRVWTLSQDLLCVLDHAGRLHSVNPAWEQLLGWSEVELNGRQSEELIHPDDLDASRAIRDVLAGGGRARHFENRLRHRDGSYRWLSWNATEENGLIYGCARDMSDEKRHAHALEQAELALRNAQRMEAVGQLTGGIAHDFNNLLASIRFSLDLIARRVPDDTRDAIAHLLRAATDAADRGAGLTHNLLAFARKQALAMHSVDLDALLHALHDELRRHLDADHQLSFDLDARGSVLSDREQLHKALLHLTDNAREAMPHGGTLHIATRELSVSAEDGDLPAGDYLSLSLQDSGLGMDEATLAHAFDPFFTTKGIGPNSGLGLSMVYGFIKQSGGHVRLRSAPGEGSCVTLYIPRDSSVKTLPQPPATPTAETPAARPRILVVEDNDLVRLLTVEVLEELGHEVLQAEDAESALPILQGESAIDLLLTDVGLPGMNGEQLARAARQVRPELPVLFATGYAEIVEIDGSELATRMSMIAKPFSIDTLREKVNAMLTQPTAG
ncbi:MAG: Blue-light-activated protein [Stenotrophomonas maltophilia]|nr:MAG: Blue-light-activated protein [Stenotrophomonas maltophilia]